MPSRSSAPGRPATGCPPPCTAPSRSPSPARASRFSGTPPPGTTRRRGPAPGPRPWYTTKAEPSTADMIAKLRRVLIAAKYQPGHPARGGLAVLAHRPVASRPALWRLLARPGGSAVHQAERRRGQRHEQRRVRADYLGDAVPAAQPGDQHLPDIALIQPRPRRARRRPPVPAGTSMNPPGWSSAWDRPASVRSSRSRPGRNGLGMWWPPCSSREARCAALMAVMLASGGVNACAASCPLWPSNAISGRARPTGLSLSGTLLAPRRR